jgi:hypothetical protein
LFACQPTDSQPEPFMEASAANSDSIAKNTIRFPHKSHTSVTPCNSCHKGESGSPKLDQSLGHGLCLDCHREQQRGPTECRGCHTR